ncbi:MAG: right-handed parallel beta-helix repeat-containing protein [Phycisphaerales bacterium]
MSREAFTRRSVGCALLATGAALAAGVLQACTTYRSASVPAAEASLPAPARVVVVDRDDVVITESCTLQFAGAVADLNGNGVVQVTAPNVVVDLGGASLVGCGQLTPQHERKGIGIRVTAPGVTVQRGGVHGFHDGIVAVGASGSTFQDLDLSDNFAQLLKSSPKTESNDDWLWPHNNDDNQWLKQYGAALWVEDCDGVTVRRVKVWRGQNGVVLDHVLKCQVYDCDCSFLSGWGVALWRSNGNVVARNALDFCVRGYSHGVYNRGQDSAGILCFEQSCDNIIAYNSATHCGDGFFGFAGKEALGENPPPPAVAQTLGTPDARKAFYKGRGCNRNLLFGNDFSDAVAHGIEMTFSFDNAFVNNIMMRCAICGVWGGYSQRTLVRGNTFAECGAGIRSGERGAINVEHGQENVYLSNRFRSDQVGVALWWDEDAGIAKTPWAEANGVLSTRNTISGNDFNGLPTAVELRATTNTAVFDNDFKACQNWVGADAASKPTVLHGPLQPPPEESFDIGVIREKVARLPGNTTPVGARREMAGRSRIVMGQYGPAVLVPTK